MIRPETITEVRRLLRHGHLSPHEIASLTGVCRTTVWKIANDERSRGEREILEDEEASTYETPPERCRSCGGLVYMPCRLCKIRATQRMRDGARNDARWPVERRQA